MVSARVVRDGRNRTAPAKADFREFEPQPLMMEDSMNQIKRRALFVGVLLALLASVGLNAKAQEDKMMGGQMGDQMMMDKSRPTVALIRADWCAACQKLEPTFKELMAEYKDRLNFVVLDVTTDEKVAQSARTARELGIGKFFEANKKNTSTVIVLGEKNKISFKTIHNYDRDAYVRAFDDAIKMNSMMMKHG
jgi:thiol-disulfide isomerase/thioredoxin